MKRSMLALEAVAACIVAAALPARAQQAPALRDFAMPGGNYYLRAPEFVDAAKATFQKAMTGATDDWQLIPTSAIRSAPSSTALVYASVLAE